MARYAYTLREHKDTEVRPLPTPARPADKPVFHITESDNSVTFDFEGFTLIVKRNSF